MCDIKAEREHWEKNIGREAVGAGGGEAGWRGRNENKS